MQALRSAAVVAMFTFLVVACGGSPAVSTNPVAKSNPPVAASSTPAAPTATATPVAPGSVVTPASVGTSPDAANICSLVTTAELASATGKTYLPGTVDIGGQCNWNTDDSGANTGASSGNLIIAAIQTQDLAGTKSVYGTGGEDVTVSGHAAFYNPGQGVNSLWVDIGGGQLFVLSFPRSGDLDPSYKDVVLMIAQDALARM